MTIFGLNLLQVFLLVLVVALAIVGAEQIRTHIINPALTKARAWLSKTEATVEGEFEKLLGHAKATVAALPSGTMVKVESGASAVTINTPESAANQPAPAAAVTPLDPVVAAKRYIAGGLTPDAGMPVLAELLYIFSLAKPAQVAWAQSAAAAIAGVFATPFEAVTVGDVGAVRPEAATYLNAIGAHYPIVGGTAWLKA